ncbi:phospholipid/glycerol acyltransferase [Janibacter hoylei PVAS-1]|uniref:Phospholipid/glycerol acyltransferase n=1 Tax=Janibacter hoylei PVAS-1 TaxID=1210046 RepID=K1E256_9MICO|nr:phospholipid/glycerol acyltransferase [Janibacter hoylei PVAS-1]
MLRLLKDKWFRVEVRGIDNIPADGGALLVSNHSGTVAIDSVITQLAIHDAHPQGRFLRMLGADLVFQLPVVGDVARKTGATLASNADAERLLRGGRARRRVAGGLQGRGQALPRALQAPALRPRRLRLGGRQGGGADHPVLRRRGRGGLPDDRQHEDGRTSRGCALRADHALLPAPRSARSHPAAEQVDHRVRRADRHRIARARGRGGPDARLRGHRPGARDDPADALLRTRDPTLGLLLGALWCPPCPKPASSWSAAPGATCATRRGR